VAKRPTGSAPPSRSGWGFFVFIILIGLGAMTPFVLQAIRDYRIAYVYEPTECQVLGEKTVSSSSTSRLGGISYTNDSSHREFSWAYVVDGTRYVADGYDNHDGIMVEGQETGNVSAGVRMPCWYDPYDPEESVLVRHFRAKFYLGALVPGLFLFLGGYFLWRTLRRGRDYADVRVSKGRRLKVRLSPVLSTRGIFGCLTVVILVLGAFIVLVLPGVSFGDVTPSLLGGLWPFLILGGIEAFLVYHWLRAMRAARVADAEIEIDDHPLSPGQQTRLHFRLPGPAQLALLKVSVLREKTDSRGTRTSGEKVLFERENINLAVAEEFDGKLAVSPRAAASLRTLQSVSSWMIRVHRVLKNGVSYDTDYPFTVLAVDDAPSAGDDDDTKDDASDD
jgi:hypothetical protein